MKCGRIITKIFLIAGLLIGIISCTDLNLNPPSKASSKTWYSSENELKMSVNDLFRRVFWQRDKIIWSDDFVRRTILSPVTDGTINGDWGLLENTWLLKYKAISRANTILKNIEKGKLKDVPQETIDKYAANVRFVRACQYSYLINHWGDVPYYTKDIDLDEAYKLSRKNKKAVLDSIYNDFDKAIPNLPKSYGGNENRYATKGAALAMKARAALYQGDWAVARDAAKAVMDLNVYELYPDYGNLFKSKTKNTKEEIFVSPSDNQLGVSYPIRSSSIKGVIPRLDGGHLNCYPSWQLVSSFLCTDGLPIDESSLYNPRKPFENRDPRLSEIAVPFGEPWLGYIYQPHPDSLKVLNVNTGNYVTNLDTRANEQYTSYNGFAWKKGITEEWTKNFKPNNDVIIMRYADVFLMYAEAKIELDDIDQSVLDAINRVRARAYKVNYTETSSYPAVTTMDRIKLRKTVRIERRMELAFEGHRYMDLIRWGLAEKALNKTIYGMLNPEKLRKKVVDKGLWFFPDTPDIDEDGMADFNLMYNKSLIRILAQRQFDAPKQYLWPIPSTDLQINDKLEQNPGY